MNNISNSRISGHVSAHSSGIAIGRAQLLSIAGLPVPEKRQLEGSIADEIKLIKSVFNQAQQELETECQHLQQLNLSEPLHILQAQLALLRDPQFYGACLQHVQDKHSHAAWAIHHQVHLIIAMFDALDNTYLRARGQDIEQIGNRLLLDLHNRNLNDDNDNSNNKTKKEDKNWQGQIIIARDISPIDLVHLWRIGVAGILLEQGGINAHNIILARSLTLPALVGAEGVVSIIQTGDLVIIDAEQGEWVCQPDDNEQQHYKQFTKLLLTLEHRLDRYRGQKSLSNDGHEIMLMGNLEFSEEVQLANNIGVAGIGLYRTEFLFLDRDSLPDEEEQYQHYKKVVCGMQGLPVTFRLLDLGTDKLPTYFIPQGNNPALGMRGVRLLLKYPNILRTQLRALLRCLPYGDVRIMLPMITIASEVIQIRRRLDELCSTESWEKPQLGVIIETPAAAIIAHELSLVADFFSIGTNDLTQYTLAADRTEQDMGYLYQDQHPAIEHLLRHVIYCARRAKIAVSVCGELAGDVTWTESLMNMGVNSLSMSLHQILHVRQRLSRLPYSLEELPLHNMGNIFSR
ncbi:MAG: phosphoenolpyruvate--protein phosphotransferase [Mariprofundales bacterium]